MADLIDKAEALLPCPFCGGEARYQADHTTERRDSVWCGACDYGMFDPEEQRSVVAAWNRRAALPARGVGEQAAFVRGMEAALDMIRSMRASEGVVIGRDLICTALEVAVTKNRAALAPTNAAHVNETPKSEHDGADVLTAAQARPCAEHPNCPPNQTCDHCAGMPSDAAQAREVEVYYKLRWIAGARPPVHPEPMNGSQTFSTEEKARAFFRSLASDAKFVSLERIEVTSTALLSEART